MLFKNETEDASYEGHESIIILNFNNKDAEVLMDIYFQDKEPFEGIKFFVPSKRVKCFRMDHSNEIGGIEVERLTRYALRFRSDMLK